MNENLNGRQLLLTALRHGQSPRVPWVPFAGVHAGFLKGYNAVTVLRDPGKLLECLMEVNRLYNPDGQPVLFDLQLEAEVLGCELLWAENAPSSVRTHPLSKDKTIPKKLPGKTDGRIPLALEVMNGLKREAGGSTALFGLICGPLTLASHLRGTDLFIDMIEGSDFVFDLFSYTREVNLRMAELYLEAGMDVIAVVDPVVSLISPKFFKKFVADDFREVFDLVRDRGALSSFFVCGNAAKNMEEMCLTGPDSIFVDENIDMFKAKQVTDKYNITLGGNIPLTTTMLYGTQQDNIKYVLELLDGLEHTHLVIAPGCDMPYNVPPDNVIAVQQTVREPERMRLFVENYIAAEVDAEIALPDYKNLARPLVEVFTIDSATCAACTYMMKEAREAEKHFGDRVEVREYKLTERDTLLRVKKLGIINLPAILINGELKYSSMIPYRKEFFEEIEKHLG